MSLDHISQKMSGVIISHRKYYLAFLFEGYITWN